MDSLAVHDKEAGDEVFAGFLAAVERESSDGRNFVKKAVNWALRQIGKRDRRLNELAIAAAGRISQGDSKAARWVASDALSELRSEAVRGRLGSRSAKLPRPTRRQHGDERKSRGSGPAQKGKRD